MSDFTHIAPFRHAKGFSFLRLLNRISAVSRQRRALAKLTDHELEDIGITRAQAEAEAKRPAWDAPHGWRQ
ncbi:DUF1127 domain-containing protein [Actibacterium mucosum]|nr:DUF1127 domain-containing protein [Actibacterium mucosum]